MMRPTGWQLPSRRDPGRIVADVHGRLARAGFDIPARLWTGQLLGPDDRGYRVHLAHPWSLRSLLLPPTDLAAGEAYVRGDIDVDGSMIAALHDVAARRRNVGTHDPTGVLERSPAGILGGVPELARSLIDVLQLPPRPHAPDDGSRRARVDGRTHSLARDRTAVRHHYDVGNDFFELFLDRRLVYSCAYFTDGDDDLDRAQERKLDLVCQKLRLAPGESFLDIGCGWGALVIHAARHHGVQATGVTLSEPQADLARKRAADAGVGERVDIRVADYREIGGRWDAVASVGMVEHVGAGMLATYFRRCYDLTAPGGRFLNHGITTGRRNEISDLANRRGSFIASHVFPDGTLVPAHLALRRLQEAGFDVHDVHQLQPHYARTLTHWVHRLEANAVRAVEVAGEATYRTWRAYMAGSVVGFATRDLGVVQILGSRGADLPLDRGWMQPQVREGATSH